MSQDGALFQWQYIPLELESSDFDGHVANDTPSKWSITHRHYFMQNNAKAKCAAYHASSSLLVAGFSNGIFCLYELPDFNLVHTLR